MFCRGRLVQWKNVRFVKFFVRGDRGSIPAKGGIFSSANFIRIICANDNSDEFRRVLPISQPRHGEAVAQQRKTTVRKGNVAQTNWPYDVSILVVEK